MNVIHYQVTHDNGEVSYFFGVQTHATPERALAAVQRAAVKRGITSTYKLIDKATYASGRAAMQARLDSLINHQGA